MTNSLLNTKDTLANQTTFYLPRNARSRFSIFLICISIPIILGVYIAYTLAYSPISKSLWGLSTLAIISSVLSDLLFFIPRRIRYTVITISNSTLSIKHGKLIEHNIIIPIKRITLITKTSSPVSRLFHHEKVKLTATTDEVSLPYLDAQDAAKIIMILTTLGDKE